jgi:hypothetical protein
LAAYLTGFNIQRASGSADRRLGRSDHGMNILEVIQNEARVVQSQAGTSHRIDWAFISLLDRTLL